MGLYLCACSARICSAIIPYKPWNIFTITRLNVNVSRDWIFLSLQLKLGNIQIRIMVPNLWSPRVAKNIWKIIKVNGKNGFCGQLTSLSLCAVAQLIITGSDLVSAVISVNLTWSYFICLILRRFCQRKTKNNQAMNSTHLSCRLNSNEGTVREKAFLLWSQWAESSCTYIHIYYACAKLIDAKRAGHSNFAGKKRLVKLKKCHTGHMKIQLKTLYFTDAKFFGHDCRTRRVMCFFVTPVIGDPYDSQEKTLDNYYTVETFGHTFCCCKTQNNSQQCHNAPCVLHLIKKYKRK